VFLSDNNDIKQHNQAMDDYVGGRVFSNRENILPKRDDAGNKIEYQEWDVNPKIRGENRGAERLCTGSDGRSWYTDDHYKTFTQIK
jgi:ribonuclease T1